MMDHQGKLHAVVSGTPWLGMHVREGNSHKLTRQGQCQIRPTCRASSQAF